ncbi:fatty acyl-AMP ligase [Methylobacterium sp. WSM2598]|uniref:fatty acyl-AMP ligase n=1 Tax=Methylobacterium sp. WSM2598 TaxID=398261 RepID=UPI00037FD693|nr:fatty acyl-AMP ligase [Methylobacterium sp. WSM2598]
MTELQRRLARWSAERPDRLAFAFMPDGTTVTDALTFGALDRDARGVARSLGEVGAGGRPVLLLCEPGPAFVTALVGCLYAGALATPVPVSRRRAGVARLAAVARDADPAAILATVDRSAVPDERLAAAPWLRVDEAARNAPAAVSAVAEDHPAVIQYTSGSTTSPKGVVLSHGNLAANLRMLRDGFGAHESSRYLSWLPLFHDMGLIAHVLAALYNGGPCWFAPPLSFFRRPETWLRAIALHGATISGAPNFAYESCVRRFPTMQLDGLSLASWEVAFCGAEAVRASTMERFSALFAPYGFRAAALRPCYGLAEATVFVTAARGVRTLPATQSPTAAPLVSCGTPSPDATLVVVDPETLRPRQDGEIGEICVSGPHVAKAYWRRPAESDATFGAEIEGPDGPVTALRTGDLGLLRDGELYVTGRLKDVILVRGETIHAEDVEQAVGASHPELDGLCAAFGLEVDGEEQVVVVQEAPRGGFRAAPETLIDAAARAVADAFGVRLYDLARVRTGAIPRTTSGKVQRGRCRALYASGELPLQGGGVGHLSLGRNQRPR